MIIAGAKVFSQAITLYRIPQDVSVFLTAAFVDPSEFILAVCVVLLLMGFVLETLSMVVIMVPVFLPVVTVLGIDSIWFGILFVIMIECALITPPVCLNLFVVQAVGGTRMSTVAKGVWPFVTIMLLTIVLLTIFPQIVLTIPNMGV